jgi:hypothetical protein
MRIICKLEKRALDANYFQVGDEGPGCGLFASWRRGPWMRIICKLEKRALDADYMQVGEEGPGCGLFASWRRGPWMRIICKRALGANYLQNAERVMNAEL